MITVNGYRAFKGVMKIYKEFGDEIEIEGSWLFRPDTGNWFHQETGDRYRSDWCEVIEDYTK